MGEARTGKTHQGQSAAQERVQTELAAVSFETWIIIRQARVVGEARTGKTRQGQPAAQEQVQTGGVARTFRALSSHHVIASCHAMS